MKTILIVEDTAINRKILKRILLAKGYAILEAENGKEALDLMQSGKYTISLVLLDLTMPVMNGYELLEKMRETELLTSIPVIVTTGSEGESAEITSLELGASDFIVKPYNAEIVCHRVESILRLCDNAALINKLEIDPLTGVYTREAFYRHAEMMMDEHPEEKFDIVRSNIENFKLVNSKYGTEMGDELLRCIADHNKTCIGADGVCGRLGADAFVVLRKSRSLRSQDEIGDLFATTFQNAPIQNFVMQYGVYQITDRSVSVQQMCDNAQLALSSIKHRYGVYYAVYDDSMRQKMLRDHQLSDYMEQALSEKQFLVYLQPKHSIETGAVAGAEALVRWIHPELGFIPPGEFIPLFERNGFITKLDRYIWEAVCAMLHGWIKEGKPLIPISVNASRADFTQEDLPGMIAELVDSYEIPHELLHFEVTESAYTDNPQQIISAVSALRAMGFLIEMDDFGSGYSSLNMLSELPIDILKLDMRFVQKGCGLLPDNKRSILSFIVSLSKWLQLPTIAEGVETKDEVELLRTMGCNYIQGYYFAKPMPIADFEEYVRQEAAKQPTAQSDSGTKREEHATLGGERALVLVAEDIESNREILRELLSPHYRVQMTNDGEEAYHFIREHHSEIGCLVLDLLMPKMDGFQLLDMMRTDGSLDEIPVIISSEVGADSELRALRLGADSFIAKPYCPEILLHHVDRAIDGRAYRLMRKQMEREGIHPEEDK